MLHIWYYEWRFCNQIRSSVTSLICCIKWQQTYRLFSLTLRNKKCTQVYFIINNLIAISAKLKMCYKTFVSRKHLRTSNWITETVYLIKEKIHSYCLFSDYWHTSWREHRARPTSQSNPVSTTPSILILTNTSGNRINKLIRKSSIKPNLLTLFQNTICHCYFSKDTISSVDSSKSSYN